MNGRLAQSVLVMTLMLSGAALCAEDVSYTIHEGETLFAIAQKTAVPVEVLCAYNGIQDAGRVRAGTSLLLPRSYTVKKGDTLFSIAKKFSVPLSELLSLNSLRDSSVIKTGGKLFIPGPNPGDASVASTQSAASGSRGAGQTDLSMESAGSLHTAKEDLVWPHPGKR
jgi:LysM repeat protein